MIHILIQTERRKAPRELAIVMNNDLRTQTGTDGQGRPIYSITPRPPQLHTIGKDVADLTDPQIVYAASWNMRSPWITVLKGNIADLNMQYLGWPSITEAEWLAANPPVLP